MTLFELFPRLLAILAALFSMIGLQRLGMPIFAACGIGLISGIFIWLIYICCRNKILPWLQSRKTERERFLVNSRKYQIFDMAKDYPRGENLFYECAVCGNVVPSMPSQDIACKCRNVMVNVSSGRIEFKDGEKVKLFSE